MSLETPTAGWIRWRFQTGPESFVIKISNIFNSLDNIWFWALELAHGFLPQILEINEEGSFLQLLASPGADKRADLILTARCLDDERSEVYFERAWPIGRVQFVEALGELFSAYFLESFDAEEWANGHGLADFAGLLPWGFPARVARASRELELLTPAQVEWVLACRLDPGLHPVFTRMSNEDRLGLFFQLTAWRRSLACRAWRGDQAINWFDEAFPANTHGVLYQQDYEQAQGLFEEQEMMREGHPDYAYLADDAFRERVSAELADKLYDWDQQMLLATELLLSASTHGPGLALSPAWHALYQEFQLVEALDRVLRHS